MTSRVALIRIMKKATKVQKLAEVEDRISNVDVIAVDEGQFFPDIVECTQKWADMGKIVIVAALDATFERKPFGSICQLVPMAESVKKLSAVCLHCSEEAQFTHKHCNNTGEINDIGGLDKYIPVCRKCFLDLNPVVAKSKQESVDSKSTDSNSLENSP